MANVRDKIPRIVEREIAKGSELVKRERVKRTELVKCESAMGLVRAY